MSSRNDLLKLCLVVVGLIAILTVSLKVKLITDRQEQYYELKAQSDIQAERIANMEKEIRLIKTDLQILEYGYEEVENK